MYVGKQSAHHPSILADCTSKKSTWGKTYMHIGKQTAQKALGEKHTCTGKHNAHAQSIMHMLNAILHVK